MEITFIKTPEKTLDFVNRVLGDFDFYIFGSYARAKAGLKGSFKHYSDLDILVDNEFLCAAVERLEISLKNYRLIEKGYGGGGDIRKVANLPKGYYITSDIFIPIHMVGSNSIEERLKPVKLEGINYIVTEGKIH